MSVEVSDRVAAKEGVTFAGSFAGGNQAKSANAIRLSSALGYMLAFEFLTVSLSAFFGSALYHYVTFGKLADSEQNIGSALFIATLFTLISVGFRHFDMTKKQQLHMLLWSGAGAVAFAFALFLTTIFLLKIAEAYSRGTFIIQIIVVVVVICISRTLFFVWFRSRVASGGIEARRAILIGDAHRHSQFIDELSNGGIRVVESFPFPSDEDAMSGIGVDPASTTNLNIRSVTKLCRTMLPDDVVILFGRKELTLASDLAHRLSELPCNIHIAPLEEVRFLTRSQISNLGSVATLRLSRPPLSLADRAIKRTFDLAAATIGLVILSPLILFVALAIKLDSRGKSVFQQRRHGYNGQVIKVFKFRTMTTIEDNDDNFRSASKNDGRVTTIGRFLRQTNIDELPQLLNVLVGDMSIVGPRPHATVHNNMFEDQILPFARRHDVKPGITGWAQVNGYRGPADTIDMMRRRVEFDLYYIDNWSFFLDMKIVMMTLFSRKAYANAF